MKPTLLLVVEGDSEKEFVKRMIAKIREEGDINKFSCKIEIENLRGIGNANKKMVRIIKNKMLGVKKILPEDLIVFLLRDQDVFELNSKPPYLYKNLKKELTELGINKFKEIKVVKSIEDWYLIDAENIKKFLNLPQDYKIPKRKNGVEVLKKMFKTKNKTYIKGSTSAKFINNLNMDKIVNGARSELEDLIKILKDEK